MAYIHRLIIVLLLFVVSTFSINVFAQVAYSQSLPATKFTSQAALCNNYTPNVAASFGPKYTVTYTSFHAVDASHFSCDFRVDSEVYNYHGTTGLPFLKVFRCITTDDYQLYTSEIESACVPPPPPACPANQNDLGGALYTSTCVDSCVHWTTGSPTYPKSDPNTTFYPLGSNTGATCTTGGQTAGAFTAAANAADAAAAAAQAASDAAAAAAAKAAADAKAAAAAQAAADAKAASDAKAAADAAAAQANADAKAAAAAAAAAGGAGGTSAAAAAAQAAADAANAAAAAAGAAAATSAGAAAQAALQTPLEIPDFCALHPSSIICKNSQINAGYCSGGKSSGFTCSGDAIQCAIAKEQQQANCQFYEKDDALKTEFDNLKAGITNNPADSANRSGVNMQNSLTVSHPAGGSCPIDKTFIVNGQQFTLKLSTYCPYLEFLGNVILVLAYLGAAKIIGGSV